MHTLLFRTSACLSCSRSTVPYGSHRCLPRCTPPPPAWRRPCSSHSRPWAGSLLRGRGGGPGGTHRASGSTGSGCMAPGLWVLLGAAWQWNSGSGSRPRWEGKGGVSVMHFDIHNTYFSFLWSNAMTFGNTINHVSREQMSLRHQMSFFCVGYHIWDNLKHFSALGWSSNSTGE